ncbi:uncharacterized protein LOC6541996 [Drosophila erecta]|uniref:uncharacterized protein LOC6541996 n=1 Tax=Drosophila erecta TaxID=7220 RepID=UPI000F04790A|nr:uncharacterized protein LOC6541996 [Drosophila erecta]
MPPVSKRSLPKRSNADQHIRAQIKKTSTLSKIIIQGTEQLLDSKNYPNIQFIEKPRKMRYSNSSISSLGRHATQQIDNVATNSKPQGMFGANEQKRTSKDVISEISNMSTSSVSVRNKPFENFLQDFCLAHGSIPRESVQQAIAKWEEMTSKQKEEFSPENYVLKLCNQVRNRDEILNAVGLNPAYQTTRKFQFGNSKASKVKRSSPRLRKSTKRLASKPRGVVSPRKSLKNAAKKQVPPMVPVRLSNSASAYKNFLRKIRQANPGLMSVEKSSLWRKMTPAEKDLYRVVNKPNQDETKDRKVSRVQASKRVRKGKASRSTQTPENALNYSERNFNIQRDGQLQVWAQSSTSLRDTRRSWLRLEYISKAFKKVKNMFN